MVSGSVGGPGGRMPPVADSAAEQPLEPAQESTALAGGGRRRCRRRAARRRLGSRRRSGGGWRLARRRGRFRRPGSTIRPRTGPGCLLHLFVVTTQDGICRHRSGDLLHLLVMPAQNGICRYCAHSRLLVESTPTIVTKISLLSPETPERSDGHHSRRRRGRTEDPYSVVTKLSAPVRVPPPCEDPGRPHRPSGRP